jgi:hypothetical protein
MFALVLALYFAATASLAARLNRDLVDQLDTDEEAHRATCDENARRGDFWLVSYHKEDDDFERSGPFFGALLQTSLEEAEAHAKNKDGDGVFLRSE